MFLMQINRVYAQHVVSCDTQDAEPYKMIQRRQNAHVFLSTCLRAVNLVSCLIVTRWFLKQYLFSAFPPSRSNGLQRLLKSFIHLPAEVLLFLLVLGKGREMQHQNKHLAGQIVKDRISHSALEQLKAQKNRTTTR